jgi:ribonuclease HII
MRQVGARHPGYGFERHMGYSVPEHCAALKALGPTIHHRRSFAPVALAHARQDAESGLSLTPESMLPL